MNHRLKSVILASCAIAMAAVLPACNTTAGSPNVTLDPVNGVCFVSADGAYAACYNPLTKGYTVKATVPGGFVKTLTYDSATKSWRGTLPDGSTAVYAGGRLTIEPAMPAAK